LKINIFLDLEVLLGSGNGEGGNGKGSLAILSFVIF
jgi:hypothetical protein